MSLASWLLSRRPPAPPRPARRNRATPRRLVVRTSRARRGPPINIEAAGVPASIRYDAAALSRATSGLGRWAIISSPCAMASHATPIVNGYSAIAAAAPCINILPGWPQRCQAALQSAHLYFLLLAAGDPHTPLILSKSARNIMAACFMPLPLRRLKYVSTTRPILFGP